MGTRAARDIAMGEGGMQRAKGASDALLILGMGKLSYCKKDRERQNGEEGMVSVLGSGGAMHRGVGGRSPRRREACFLYTSLGGRQGKKGVEVRERREASLGSLMDEGAARGLR